MIGDTGQWFSRVGYSCERPISVRQGLCECVCVRTRVCVLVWPFNGQMAVLVILAATLTVIAPMSLLVAAPFP